MNHASNAQVKHKGICSSLLFPVLRVIMYAVRIGEKTALHIQTPKKRPQPSQTDS